MPSFEDPLDYFLRKFISGWRGRGFVANALLTVVVVLVLSVCLAISALEIRQMVVGDGRPSDVISRLP